MKKGIEMEQQKTEAEIELEIEQLKKVTRKDSKKKYAQAQLKLASIYYVYKKDLQQAIDHLLNIKKQDNLKVYAQAQFNLGVIYQYKYKNFEQAEDYYLKVEKDDNPKVYAQAQLYLGIIYEKDNIEQAERYYLNVKKQDNPKVYAQAQLYLGIIYEKEKDNIEQAERYYLNVEKQDNPYIYAYAQAKLGDNAYYGITKNKLKPAEEYYQNVVYSNDTFQIYIIAQMMLSVISNKNSSIFDKKQRYKLVVKICNIRKLTIEIQEELFVKFNLNEFKNNDGQVFERQVAHYTKPEVVFNLLKNKPSDFRLNVVDFMNDPTENQVLTDWLGVNTENNDEIKTFLASFSFNHNSLNQFRLYGNENNIVGSSVSMVFNKKFFGDDINRSINPASINYFFNKTDFCLPINDLNENSPQKDFETVAQKNIISSVGFLPLFRCLYFDPKSGYISIAKRNKYSFYLEYQNSHDLNVYNKWKAYLNSLKQTKKINTIRKKLKEIEKIVYLLKNPENPQLKEIIEKIEEIVYSLNNPKNPKPKEIIEKIEKIVFSLKNSKNPEPKEIIEKTEEIIFLLKNCENPEQKEIIEEIEEIVNLLKNPEQKEMIKRITNLDQLIALALMPISCLVKHAAFEDEDECRMIYITNIADDLIQAPTNYAYANSLFVNYGKIEDYLEKIYLGPQCQPHHKLWITNHVRTSKSNTRNKPIKVVQSEMPLR